MNSITHNADLIFVTISLKNMITFKSLGFYTNRLYSNKLKYIQTKLICVITILWIVTKQIY